jgi:hypothetical protein
MSAQSKNNRPFLSPNEHLTANMFFSFASIGLVALMECRDLSNFPTNLAEIY